jgi:hypothetical protein
LEWKQQKGVDFMLKTMGPVETKRCVPIWMYAPGCGPQLAAVVNRTMIHLSALTFLRVSRFCHCDHLPVFTIWGIWGCLAGINRLIGQLLIILFLGFWSSTARA